MRNHFQNLYEIAEGQQGYFTARQAQEAGYSEFTHPYHVKTGSWIREARAIYRLSSFPKSDQSHYVLWALWSCNRQGSPQGVFSHQTALSIHELSDLNPAKIHITVPKTFRRRTEIPKVLVIHRENVRADDLEQKQGFQLVKPLRTILMLEQDHGVSRDFLIQALDEGLKRGLITKSSLRHPTLSKQERAFLAKLLKEARP